MMEAGKWAAKKLVAAMGCPDWGATCIANYGNHTKYEEIMSKYRPIAPKPTIVSPNLHECNSNSDYACVLNSSSRFAKTKGNHSAEVGRTSRSRRRALDCCVSPSARGQKRARGPNTISDLASQQSHSALIDSESVRANRSKIACVFNCSLIIDKDPYFMGKAESNASVRTILDQKNAGLGLFNIKGMNPSDCLEVVSVQRKAEDTQCGCGSAKGLVFPIQEEESKRNNLVTLPLLPGTPSLKDSVVEFPASNLSSTVAYSKHKAGNASHDKEEFPLRLFGRDLSPKEVGSRGFNQ